MSLANLAAKRIHVWRRDIRAFVSDIWRGEYELTPQQGDVGESVIMHRKTAVASANGTGKTNLAAFMQIWYPLCWHGSFVISAGPNFNNLKEKLWQETALLFNKAEGHGFKIGGEFLPDSCTWKLGDKWFVSGQATKNESAFHGGHASRCLFIIEEAQDVPQQIYNACDGMMQSPHARLLAIGNPLTAKGPFYAAFKKPREWHGIHLSALDHPNVVSGEERIKGAVTRQWVEERRQSWGESDPRYIARVLGEFPEGGDTNLVTLAMLDAAETDCAALPGAGWHIGVDVARFGSDETVICITEDQVPRRMITMSGKNGTQVAGAVIQAMQSCGITPEDSGERCHVDPIGVGASVVDSLADSGWWVDEVDFGGKPRGQLIDELGEMKFANLRAECYWRAREAIAARESHVPIEFAEIREELSAVEYDFNRRGEVLVEKKSKIKEKLGRSPDSADAFVLALARQDASMPELV